MKPAQKEIRSLDNYREVHCIHKSNWLRAAVLGANDGIISVTSLSIGVVSANASRESIVLATVAGLVAGALSMAAGEYVSVSSQTDIEKADIQREKIELEEDPAFELQLLASIYEERGLKKETALLVAKELTEKDALAAHVRDELGISSTSKANPLQAALASGASFVFGGVLPLMVVILVALNSVIYVLYATTIIALLILGATSAKIGGAGWIKAALRVSVLGTIAMVFSAFVGYLFGVNV